MTRLNGATVDPNAELQRGMLLNQYALLKKRGEALLRIAEEGDALQKNMQSLATYVTIGAVSPQEAKATIEDGMFDGVQKAWDDFRKVDAMYRVTQLVNNASYGFHTLQSAVETLFGAEVAACSTRR
jgi:hypothetical protein